MAGPTTTAALIAQGFLLGWSVAWPPGPINAEMIRRGLGNRRGAAVLVGLGACTGDFLWALVVMSGLGAAAQLPAVRHVLVFVSTGLLLALAFLFLRGAWGEIRRCADAAAGRNSPVESARGGFVLGMTMALTSPWNIAFWIGVIGPQSGRGLPVSASLVLALAVMAGALTWVIVLCSAVRMGARFASHGWIITTQAATGMLMLFFAARTLQRAFHG